MDFAEMKRRVGVTSGDILDVMGTWSEARQAQANAVIAEMETEARENMTLMPGLHALVAALDGWGLRRGILTRNVTTSVDWLHARHLQARASSYPPLTEIHPMQRNERTRVLVRLSVQGLEARLCTARAAPGSTPGRGSPGV
jgi:hypothetical protein